MPHAHHPRFDPALRITVLTPELSLRQIQRRIRTARVIAAATPVLRALAEAVESGRVKLPPIEAAVVAFTGICHGELTVLERDLFWRVFQVPVFEQLLARDGRVMAMECDAHDGLHVLDPAAPLDGYSAILDATPCGCGNRQPRLTALTRLAELTPPAVISAAA
jgi:hypothetical protein